MRLQEGREEYSTFNVRRGGCEEIILIQGKEQRLHFAGAAMKRYSTSKVGSGSCEKIPHIQGEEQGWHFAGAAMKRYSTSKVRETPVRQ